MATNKPESYADYLTGASAASTSASAVPATTPTASAPSAPKSYTEYLTTAYAPATSGVKTYADFLATMQNNHKVENTPTNAMSYADYLAYTGRDIVGEFVAKRRQSEIDYYKGLATYGQAAEKMAKAGLGGSGYADYLSGQAYAARAKGITEAQKTASSDQKASFASYADYLAGVRADSANTDAQNKSLLAEATSTLSSALESGMSFDAAAASLKGIYDQTIINQVKANLGNSSVISATSAMNTATGMADYFTGLQSAKQQGLITDEAQYNALVGQARTKNYSFIKTALETGDFGGLTAYASAYGIDLSAGNDEALNALVDYAAANGHIEKSQMQEYYFEQLKGTANDQDLTTKDVINSADKVGVWYQSGKISTEQRDQLLAALGENCDAITTGGIEWLVDNSSGSGASYKKTTTVYYTINKGENNEREGGTQLSFKPGMSTELQGEFTTVYTSEDGKTNIGHVNGQLAIRYEGKCYKLDYVKGPENNAFVAWVLTQTGPNTTWAQ